MITGSGFRCSPAPPVLLEGLCEGGGSLWERGGGTTIVLSCSPVPPVLLEGLCDVGDAVGEGGGGSN